MKKTVLREYLKNREEKTTEEVINEAIEKSKLKDLAKLAINTKMCAKPKRVKQKGEE